MKSQYLQRMLTDKIQYICQLTAHSESDVEGTDNAYHSQQVIRENPSALYINTPCTVYYQRTAQQRKQAKDAFAIRKQMLFFAIEVTA